MVINTLTSRATAIKRALFLLEWCRQENKKEIAQLLFTMVGYDVTPEEIGTTIQEVRSFYRKHIVHRAARIFDSLAFGHRSYYAPFQSDITSLLDLMHVWEISCKEIGAKRDILLELLKSHCKTQAKEFQDRWASGAVTQDGSLRVKAWLEDSLITLEDIELTEAEFESIYRSERAALVARAKTFISSYRSGNDAYALVEVWGYLQDGHITFEELELNEEEFLDWVFKTKEEFEKDKTRDNERYSYQIPD